MSTVLNKQKDGVKKLTSSRQVLQVDVEVPISNLIYLEASSKVTTWSGDYVVSEVLILDLSKNRFFVRQIIFFTTFSVTKDVIEVRDNVMAHLYVLVTVGIIIAERINEQDSFKRTTKQHQPSAHGVVSIIVYGD